MFESPEILQTVAEVAVAITGFTAIAAVGFVSLACQFVAAAGYLGSARYRQRRTLRTCIARQYKDYRVLCQWRFAVDPPKSLGFHRFGFQEILLAYCVADR